MSAAREIWKPIPWQPDYSVSDRGRVRVRERIVVTKQARTPTRFCGARIIKQHMRHGCLVVTVFLRSGRRRASQVARLVLEAHRGGGGPGKYAHHRDGWSTNNRLSNLEWRDRPNDRTKLTIPVVRRIRVGRLNGETYASLARRYGICLATCYMAATSKTWKMAQSMAALERARRMARKHSHG